MARPADLPDETRLAPFTVRRGLELGLTHDVLRGARFRTPFRGVRVHVDLADSLHLRCAAAALVLPEHAAFSHRTGARLRDWPVPGRWTDALEAAGPGRVTRQPGLRVEQSPWLLQGRRVLDGLPVLGDAWLWLSLAERLPLDDLVVAGDAALRQGEIRRSDLHAVVEVAGGRRWVIRAREAVALVVPGVDSGMETRLRLLVVRSGLPVPVVHQPVVVDGDVLLHPDLSYPDRRVALEYEGDHHRTDRAQWQHDVWRVRALEAAGWVVVRFTADDVLQRSGRAMSHLRAVLARRPPNAELPPFGVQSSVWSPASGNSAWVGRGGPGW